MQKTTVSNIKISAPGQKVTIFAWFEIVAFVAEAVIQLKKLNRLNSYLVDMYQSLSPSNALLLVHV